MRRATAVLVLACLAVLAACGDDGGAPLGRDAGPPTTDAPQPGDPAPTTEAPDVDAPGPDVVDPPAVPARVELPQPLRAVWVHLFDDSLKTPAGMDAVLDRAEAAGLNAVFVQVVRRHDAYYRSEVLPATTDPGLAEGFDVLEAAIEGGRARGLQIHAWFTVATATHPSYDRIGFAPGHVTGAHGPGSADPWMTVSSTGAQSSDYFDIGLPEVQDHVAAIIGDIAGRYDVDGVHLDYVRYDGAEWGYHPRALARFAEETGRPEVPAVDDPAWSAWRRDQARTVMVRARQALADARPEALLSAAVIAQRAGPAGTAGGFSATPAFAEYRQDWPEWVASDLLDLAIPMAYFRADVPEHAGWFTQWLDFAADLDAEHDAAVAVGIGGWLNAPGAGAEQASRALTRTAGAVVFSFQQDTSGAEAGSLLRAVGG